MLDGWYCRSMADAAAAAEEEEEIIEESKCKKQYKFLKRKLKNLIYENECFQESLRDAQKRLLVVTRERSFLLDRLLQLEHFETSSESNETGSSDDEPPTRAELLKRRKVDTAVSSSSTVVNSAKKKKMSQARPPQKQHHFANAFIHMPSSSMASGSGFLSDGHMTPEEVERHLQSRQTYVELMPERAPLTVPTEMFSNEPSLDSESNDIGELETSPNNIGEELNIDMIND